jgi:hypothetical protein
MKKTSITFIMLTMAFTLLIVSVPGHAFTDKVILNIEGMT